MHTVASLRSGRSCVVHHWRWSESRSTWSPLCGSRPDAHQVELLEADVVTCQSCVARIFDRSRRVA